MDDYIRQLQGSISLIQGSIPFALLLIGVLWLIWLLNKIIGYRLNVLGVLPRHAFGLVGIFFHPIVHGSFNHLFFNSIPLLVLLTFVLTTGFENFLCVTIVIILANGILLWLFGRRAFHIGASGLVMGYWSYLLVFAYNHPSILTYVLALICLYYFGGLLLSIFPSEERASWEGHLFGLIAGIAAVYLCPLISS